MNSMMTTTLEKKVFIFSNNRLFSMPLFEETYFFSLFKNKDFPIKQENRTFRKAFLMMSASQKVRKYAAFWHLFF